MRNVTCILCMEDLDASCNSYGVSTEGIAKAVPPRKVRAIVAREAHPSGKPQPNIEVGSVGGIRHRAQR